MLSMLKKVFPAILPVALILGICPTVALSGAPDVALADAPDVALADAPDVALADTPATASESIDTFADDADIAGGTIGTCTWVIDAAGCLTISPEDGVSGEFSMGRIAYENSWPWHSYRENILSVKVNSGVSVSGSLRHFFAGCSSLAAVDLSGLDVSNVTDMGYMFYNCSALVSLDLSGLNTSNVTGMNYMFDGCSSLTALDLSGFDTSSVTSMSSLFFDCSALTALDLSNFNTSCVTNMGSIFYNCSSLVTLDLSDLDTSNVAYMSSMFENCTSLTSIDLTGFNTSGATGIDAMFFGCTALTSLDLSNFDTSNVTYMSYMFYNCTSLASLNISSFDTSNVESMSNIFYNCTGLRSVTVGEKFEFLSNLPTPVKNGSRGRWMNDDGTVYTSPARIPSNVATTYTAVFLTPSGKWSPGFYDVCLPKDWYFDSVYYLVDLGIITGYNETTFGVGDPMTRAQLVTTMWRYCEPDAYANYNEAAAKNTSGLPDVADGQYYTEAVNWAVAHEVVTGYELADGSYIFAPDDSVTFDQMVTIVARYVLGFDGAASYNDSVLFNSRFTDGASVEEWACGSMAWSIDNGVVTGNNNGNGTYTIDALSNVARERAATVLARSIQSGLITPN